MKITIFLSFMLICYSVTFSQNIGTLEFNSEFTQDGYTIFAPLNQTSTFLIDNCGRVVKEWVSGYPPGNEVFLDESGNLWRAGRTNTDNAIGTGGRGGIIEVYNWEGGLIWSYQRCSEEECMHHDFKRLENGNLLILVWDRYSAEEGIAQGVDENEVNIDQGVWSEYIEEISIDLSIPNQASTVWQWHVWDHLVQDHDETKPNFGVVADNPHKINLNYAQDQADWLHANGLDYNADLDQIIISIPRFHEFWIIDHNTSNEESASTQGDLLYRWGNPASYDQGTVEDQQLFFQHNPHWVKDNLRFGGDIMVFNNRNMVEDVMTSAVDVISPIINEDGTYEMMDNQFLPEAPYYRYLLPVELVSDRVSGAQVMENGNLLICSGTNGTLIEITEDEEVVWEYKVPIYVNGDPVTQGADLAEIQLVWVFKAYKYAPDFEGFTGLDLTPNGYIETNSESSYCEPFSVTNVSQNGLEVFPNPAQDVLNVKSDLGVAMVEIHTLLGNHILAQDTSLERISISHLNPGMYVLSITSHSGKVTQAKFIKN